AAAAPSVPRAVAAALAARLRDPLARAARPLVGDALDAAIEATIAERRAWTRRTVLGVRATVARLHPATGEAVPTYLPEPCDARLPLAARVRVALFAAVHARQEPGEAAPISLRAVAVARAIDLPS
ncbi:MAG TPA: hypothetical protein VHB21_26340, partial [Minicystis sp.]|nr:hypothetical protein [Minicystis sp.]